MRNFGGQTECIMGNWKIVNTVCVFVFSTQLVTLALGIPPYLPGYTYRQTDNEQIICISRSN